MADDYDKELIEKYAFSSPELTDFVTKVYENDIKRNWEKIFNEGRQQGYIDEKISNRALFVYLDIISKGMEHHKEIYNDPKKNLKLIKELTSPRDILSFRAKSLWLGP